MSDEVQLEEEWAREKAAKQAAGRDLKPVRKSRKGLIVALVGVAVAAAMVAVVIYAGDEPAPATSDSDTVKIEMRAIPTAEIRVDGKKVGTTPLALTYPRSTKEIRIEATMMRHWVKRGAQKDEKFVDRRTVTLDRDRLLDFKISTAKLEDSGE